jgi:hypothetical protein
MSQPLAVLNDEEMHWLNDLGLPNQRRWLNHRNSVTNTAERFPPPPRIVAYVAIKRHTIDKKDQHKKAQKSQNKKTGSAKSFLGFFVAEKLFVANRG